MVKQRHLRYLTPLPVPFWMTTTTRTSRLRDLLVSVSGVAPHVHRWVYCPNSSHDIPGGGRVVPLVAPTPFTHHDLHEAATRLDTVDALSRLHGVDPAAMDHWRRRLLDPVDTLPASQTLVYRFSGLELRDPAAFAAWYHKDGHQLEQQFLMHQSRGQP